MKMEFDIAMFEAAGLSQKQIVALVKMFQAKADEKLAEARNKNRIRVRNQRERARSAEHVQAQSGTTEHKQARGTRLPEDWQPNERHFIEGRTLGHSHEGVLASAHDMRLWADANAHRPVARKLDWDKTFSGWLRRNKPKGQMNGRHSSELQTAFDNLMARAENRSAGEPDGSAHDGQTIDWIVPTCTSP